MRRNYTAAAQYEGWVKRKRAEKLQRKQIAEQDNNPADLSVVLLLVAGFTCALPPEDYRIRLAPAPRYRPGHPYYKYSSMGGSSCGIKERSGLDAVLSEWSDIYGASPPADSRLLAHYMTTPPEAPPVKLRRKAGYDAGSAFRRWALRRGKGE